MGASYQTKFAAVSAKADGNNPVIPAPGAKSSILVLGYSINVNAAGVIKLQDNGVPAVFAEFEFIDGGGAQFAGNLECPAFKVTEGKALEINNAAGVDCTGHITYLIV